jgi:hypothetical protein
MMNLIRMFLSTCLVLVVLDFGVASVLRLAERQGSLTALVDYFEYGRSVPGKLDRWDANPDMPGNLFDLAWPEDHLRVSAAQFAAETPGSAPVLRTYGMSFVNRITAAAEQIDPDLHVDVHAGPAAAPNFTFSMFLDDRPNRRAGDIVGLGILSSSSSALGSFSNRVWSFEQPAPYTYPVFRPEGPAPGLSRTDPVLTSAAQQRALDSNPELNAAWTQQLREQDTNYTRSAFELSFLDQSPFMRLARRALATSAVRQSRDAAIKGDFPVDETLTRMITQFAQIAREDGQIPVVFLIQTQGGTAPDLLATLGPVLKDQGVAYLATADMVSPKDSTAFLPDGHYLPEIDARFAEHLLQMPELATR